MEPFKRGPTKIATMDTGTARRADVFVEIEYDAVGRLSIGGYALRPGARDWDEGGQMQDTIAELDASELLITPTDRRRLVEIWNRWHLNDMRAECEHQRALGWPELAGEEITIYHWRLRRELEKQLRDAQAAATTGAPAVAALARQVLSQGWPDRVEGPEPRLVMELAGAAAGLWPEEMRTLTELPRRMTTPDDRSPGMQYEPNGPTYEGDTYNVAVAHRRRGHTRQDEHPDGLLGAPCTECGYRYGTAWLREDVPEDVLEWLRAFPSPPAEKAA